MLIPTPSDADTERVVDVGSQSYGRRLGGSLVGVVLGFLLFAAAIGLLVWNEARAVQALRGLGQAARDVTEVSALGVNSAHDGQLVHLTGTVVTKAPLSDPAMGVWQGGLIHLKRTVEMYQWKESRQSNTSNQIGGTETTRTTYSYAKKWSEQPVDSSDFKARLRHENPPMPIRTKVVTAEDATIGDRNLAPSLLTGLDVYEWVSLPAQAPPGYVRTDDGFYKGANADAPEIGDLRVSFAGIPVQIVSVVAQQNGAQLSPFQTRGGYKIGLVVPGEVSASAMVARQQSRERLLTWVLRAAGFFLFAFALMLIASPLSELGRVVPYLGSIIGGGVIIFAFCLAIPLTLVTVGLAWIGFRPVFGLALLLGATLFILGYRRFRYSRLPAPVPTAPAAPV